MQLLMQKPNSWLCFQSLKSIKSTKSTLELIKSTEFPFLHSRNDFDLFSCLYLDGIRFYSRIPFSVKTVFEDGNVNGVEIYLWNWDAYAEGSFKSYWSWIATSSQQNVRFVMSYYSFDRPRTVEA